MLNDLDRLKLGIAQCEEALAQADPIGLLPFIQQIKNRVQEFEVGENKLSADAILHELDGPEFQVVFRAMEEQLNEFSSDLIDRFKITAARLEHNYSAEDPLVCQIAEFRNDLIARETINPTQTSSQLIQIFDVQSGTLLPLLEKYKQALELELSVQHDENQKLHDEIQKLRSSANKKHLLLAACFGLGTVIADLLTPLTLKSYEFNLYSSGIKFIVVFAIVFVIYRFWYDRKLNRAIAATTKASKKFLRQDK